MKAALMNQNTLPIIGSGPLASAPVATDTDLNLYYASTDFGVCKNTRCLKIDHRGNTSPFVDDSISSKINLTGAVSSDWSIKLVLKANYNPVQSRLLFVIKNPGGTNVFVMSAQTTGISAYFNNDSGGGSVFFTTAPLTPLAKFSTYELVKIGVNASLYIDGALIGTKNISGTAVDAYDRVVVTASAELSNIYMSRLTVLKSGSTIYDNTFNNNIGLYDTPIIGIASTIIHRVGILGVGDSITAGVGSTGGTNGWFIYGGSNSVLLRNSGIPSGTTAQFYDSFATFTEESQDADACFYSPYTPNGMTPTFNLTEEEATKQKNNFALAYALAKKRNIKIIPTMLAPLDSYTLEQDDRRLDIIRYAEELTNETCVMITPISTNSAPNRWIPAYTNDSLHPNQAGYDLMRPIFNARLDADYSNLATAVHSQTWIPLSLL